MQNKIIEKCLELLKNDDVKRQLKLFASPFIEMVLQEIYPYIYLACIFLVVTFLLNLATFILQLRSSRGVKPWEE